MADPAADDSDEDLFAPGVSQAFGGGVQQRSKGIGAKGKAAGKGRSESNSEGKGRSAQPTGYEGFQINTSYHKICETTATQRQQPYGAHAPAAGTPPAGGGAEPPPGVSQSMNEDVCTAASAVLEHRPEPTHGPLRPSHPSLQGKTFNPVSASEPACTSLSADTAGCADLQQSTDPAEFQQALGPRADNTPGQPASVAIAPPPELTESRSATTHAQRAAAACDADAMDEDLLAPGVSKAFAAESWAKGAKGKSQLAGKGKLDGKSGGKASGKGKAKGKGKQRYSSYEGFQINSSFHKLCEQPGNQRAEPYPTDRPASEEPTPTESLLLSVLAACLGSDTSQQTGFGDIPRSDTSQQTGFGDIPRDELTAETASSPHSAAMGSNLPAAGASSNACSTSLAVDEQPKVNNLQEPGADSASSGQRKPFVVLAPGREETQSKNTEDEDSDDDLFAPGVSSAFAGQEARQTRAPPKVCQWFLDGQCWNGDKCRNLHERRITAREFFKQPIRDASST